MQASHAAPPLHGVAAPCKGDLRSLTEASVIGSKLDGQLVDLCGCRLVVWAVR